MTQLPQQRTTATKATESAKKVRPLVKEMSRRAREAAAEGKPVAYCFVMGLYDELLRAMDVTPVWTENFAGVCAAKRDIDRFIDAAAADGFARNLCSYALCGLGFDRLRSMSGAIPDNAPDGGMARPTMMLGAGAMICDARYKWFQACQRYNNVPVHIQGLLWPPGDASIREVEPYYIRYNTDELKGTVEFLERQTGRKMDWDRLAEIMDIGERTRRILYEAYQLRKAVPAPMPTEDALSVMVPGRYYMGSPEALEFYQGLYDELKYRSENHIGVIPEEKYRILWAAGLPPWFALNIFNYFESLSAVFPIEASYRPSPPVEVPSGLHPLERMATRWFREMTFWHEKAQKNSGDPDAEFVIHLIDEFKVDGMVVHRALSCRPIHLGQMHLLNIVKRYRDLPAVTLESDMADPKTYSEEEFRARIDAFIEVVAAHKKRPVVSR